MQRRVLKTMAITAVGATALALAAVAIRNRLFSGTYLRFDTMFGKTRVYQVSDDAGRSVRLLEVDGIVQSGTYVDDDYTDLVFEYLKMLEEKYK